MLDHDNDGLLDLVALSPQGPVVARNLSAGGWSAASGEAAGRALDFTGTRQFLASDADADGDLDLVAFDRRGGETASMLVHNYPDAWAKLYVGLDLSTTDPIRRAGERSITGFEWRDVGRYIPLSRGDRQLLSVARESGVGDGFTVPRHLPGEATGSCSFAVGPRAAMPGDMLNVAEIIGAIAIARARELMGATNPKDAAPGTIRADFADSIDANAVHGSDAPETAKVEIAYFFDDTEISSR